MEEYDQVDNAYVCRYCKGSFDLLENLQKHVQQIHTIRSFTKTKLCPLCGQICIKNEIYRDHLKHIHRQQEEGKAFLLKCFNDFFVWKNELEKRNYCKYVQKGQPRVLPSSKEKIHVYCCNSSSPKSKDKKNIWSATDSCPSVISAMENLSNRTIKVEHWNNHVGHTIHGEELEAAIDSLQDTEVVIEEHSYQDSDHDSQNAIYFYADADSASYSETLVKETLQKPSHALFHNNDSSSNSGPRKFSFKKDPTKKSHSFSGSLASVACMKASIKRDSAITTISSKGKGTSGSKSTVINVKGAPVMESASTTNANKASDALKTPAASGVMQTDTQPVEDSNSTPTKKLPVILKRNTTPTKGKKTVNIQMPIMPVSSSAGKTIGSAISESLLSNLKGIVNDKKLNGQFILLNSAPGQNGQQSLILCPVAAGSNIEPVATNASKKKEQPLKSQQLNATSSDILSTTNEGKIAAQPSLLIQEASGKLKCSTKFYDSKKVVPRKKILPAAPKPSMVNAIPSSIPNIQVSNSLTNTSNTIPLKIGSTVPTSVAGSINGLAPGLSFIQINNSLIPISNMQGSGLNSNLILKPPESSAESPLIGQPPVLGFSNLAPVTTSTASSTASNVLKSTIPATSAKGQLPATNLPLVILSSPLGSNAATALRPGIPAPLSVQRQATAILNSLQSTKSFPTSPNRPALVQSTAQFVPAAPLLGFSQSGQRQTLNFRGPRPISSFAPSVPQVKPFNLPVSNATWIGKTVSSSPTTCSMSSVVSNSLPIGSAATSCSTSSAVSKSLPIRSTPTTCSVSSVVSKSLPIPSTTPVAHPQKPGSFIFESSGDLYMLEPVEDSESLKKNLPKKQTTGTLSKEANVKSPLFPPKLKVADNSGDKFYSSLSSKTYLRFTENASPGLDEKIEPKAKRLKTCSTFFDGHKIAALPQKRLFKEEDSDILKKVKYYNLEMKYLESQAECKRLKLELAKAAKKNRPDLMLCDKALSEEAHDITNIPSVMPKHNTLSNDIQVIEKLIEDLLEKVEDFQAEKEIVNQTYTHKDSNESKDEAELPLAKDTDKETIENDKSKLEIDCDAINDEMDFDIGAVDSKEDMEMNAKIPSKKDNETDDNANNLDELLFFSSVEDQKVTKTVDDPPVENEWNDSKEHVVSVDSSKAVDESDHDKKLIDECVDSFETQPDDLGVKSESNINKMLSDQIQIIENIEAVEEMIIDDAFEVEGSESNNVQPFEDLQIKIEQAIFNDVSDDKDAQETLKDLEVKYGEPSSDIYTMIRTSVLRSLYDDMKDLCQENKKLFEELQSLKNNGEPCQIIVQDVTAEQL